MKYRRNQGRGIKEELVINEVNGLIRYGMLWYGIGDWHGMLRFLDYAFVKYMNLYSQK